MPDFYSRSGGEVLVNSETSGDQNRPDIAVFADGGFVVIWTDFSAGFADIRAQRFDSGGNPLGGEFTVNSVTDDSQLRPRVTVLQSGRFVVTWDDDSGEGGDASNFAIKAQLFEADGTMVGGEFLVNGSTTLSQSNPAIGALVGGGFVISWSDASGEGGDSSGLSVKARRFDADGNAVGTEFLVNSFTLGSQGSSAITALPSGGFAIAWSGYNPDFSYPSIFVQTFDALGSAVGPEHAMPTDGSDFNQLYPSLAATATGFVVVWQSDASAGGDAIKARRFDTSGAPLGEVFEVAVTSDDAGLPHVQSVSGGGFLVTWSQAVTAGDMSDIQGQIFDANGAWVGPQFVLNGTTSGRQTASRTVLLPTGEIAAVYVDQSGLGGDASGSAVKLQLLAASDSIAGGSGDDVIPGGPGDNEIDGGAGNDVLIGAAGADDLDGGSGSDTASYAGSGASVNVDLGRAGAQSGGDAEGDILSNIENVSGSSHADTLTGDDGANVLSGGGGNDALDGGGGADTMRGGTGDDRYVVDQSGDKVVEASGQGTDTVRSSIEYTLPSHVENLSLTGSAAINGTGNGQANQLVGNAAANRLDGQAGADTMRGGGGNDAYVVDRSTDKVIEAKNQGNDTVRSSVTYTLPENVENLSLTGADSIHGTGNSLANVLMGNAKPNRLDGGAGADTMRGGNGHDVYIVDNGGDQVVERADEGTDTVRSYITYTLPDHVEALALGGAGVTNATGNALANRLDGNAKANVLDGGAGADTMKGGLGHDTYIVDNAQDRAVESFDGGVDTVRSSVSYGLIPNLENLYLTGTAAIDGTGNATGNRLVGNSAANKLDGARGADRMEGRRGNDTYMVDHSHDTVIELANEGVDRVRSVVTFTLPQNVEILILEGSAAINGLGNAQANQLVGNRQKNVLDGGAGADTMKGGFGNDTYVVDDAGDVVVELANEGADRVKSSISYTLTDHVEHLALSGREAINATGNALANKIVGNQGANTLDGAGGADRMEGRGGNDTFVVDHSGDVVVELANEGTDRVRSSISYTLTDHVENLSLTGSAAINGTGNDGVNRITGNAAANVLNGGGGEDTLRGGGGKDSFHFTARPGNSNTALIEDFVVGEDRILLGGGSGQPFEILASGALGAHAFRNGTAAADADDRIIYNRSTGAIMFDADGAGGAAAVRFASVAPGLVLSATDFFVSGPENRLPAFSSGTSASIAENSSTSTIVYQAQAGDPDGDAITYSLGGADASLFTIDPSGAVRLLASADYEARTSYSLTITARDSGPTGATRNLTVNVIDVDDDVDTTTRLIEWPEANGSVRDAQEVHRAFLNIADNANLTDDSLRSAMIVGDVSTPTDVDFYSITLFEGELLILDVDNSGGNLDSVLNLYGPQSEDNPITSNDDHGVADPGSAPHPEYGHNTDSFISFRAPQDGTYTFSIGAFRGGSESTQGSYQLNVSVGPRATPAQRLEEDIRAMLSGEKWSNLSLTYGFPTRGSDYRPGEWTEEIAAGMSALTTLQQTAVRNVLTHVANLTNLAFTQAGSPGSGDLRYALSNLPETAYAAFPGSGAGGDSWYNRIDYASPTRGNYDWTGFLHETGHALGLKHPHEAPAVSLDRDMVAYSVMSYRSYEGAPVDETGGYTNETWGYPQTYMMLDIAALQRLYGADFTYNSGNTTYSWSPSTGAFMINGDVQWTPGANRVFMTIWDGGGTDTYDLSNYSGGVQIDLRPGRWTSLLETQRVNLGDGNDAPGHVANALLFNGDTRSLIENAIGGSGPDRLIANEAANRLTGGGGSDRFQWASVGDSRPDRADTILDFIRGTDKIDLSAIDTDPSASGDQGFEFVGTAAFSGRDGELRYAIEGGNAHIFADVDGDRVADLEIIVSNLTSLSGSDFML